jgi:hypothetical protein
VTRANAMKPQRPATKRRGESGVFMGCWLWAELWCSLTLTIHV